MKNSLLLGLVILLTFGITACQNMTNDKASSSQQSDEASPTDSATSDNPLEKNGLKLSPMTDSPTFDQATLKLKAPQNASTQDTGKVKFSFDVTNYDLGSQTPDAPQKQCANSAKGQHIHLIVNNLPYSAHYVSDFERPLQTGSYLGLAFLSRSYHESLKHASAAQLFEFTVGEPAEKTAYDLTAPHLLYSRPKGQYVGKGNVEKIMLDFYLFNTQIAADGNKVKATINGTEFLLDRWQPYFVEGLPMGDNTFALELIDKDGKSIEGPFNKVERTINLQAEEPLKD